jgi:hypothetical protein
VIETLALKAETAINNLYVMEQDYYRRGANTKTILASKVG